MGEWGKETRSRWEEEMERRGQTTGKVLIYCPGHCELYLTWTTFTLIMDFHILSRSSGTNVLVILERKLEKASTQKSATTHTSVVFCAP